MLAVARVTTPNTTPERWLVFLHGILGSGANWRTFARQVVTARPDWGALLVDLRLHGDSLEVPPPHTIAAAARDVIESTEHVHAVLGHSFGGKVGIELARQLAAEGKPLEQLFVIDSTPSARPDHRGSSGVLHIVELLRELPTDFENRAAFTAWVEARGVSRPTAMWLAMNIRPASGDVNDPKTRFVFRIDVPSVRTMMEDYFLSDLWPFLELPSTTKTHLIAGGKSEVLDAADRERGRSAPNTTVDVIAKAGHWVHVDAPDELRTLVLGYL